MPVRYKTQITKSGPFFMGDPTKKWSANKRAFMARWAEMGEQDVVGQLRSGEGSRQPLGMGLRRTSQHVHGRVRALSGKDWRQSAVVSVNNSGLSQAQGIKLMAAAAYLEGRFHAFRKARGRLRRARDVNVDMLKGLR